MEREITILKSEYDELVAFKTKIEDNKSIEIVYSGSNRYSYIAVQDINEELLKANRELAISNCNIINAKNDIIKGLKNRTLIQRIFNKKV